jgi:hypothetical protein
MPADTNDEGAQPRRCAGDPIPLASPFLAVSLLLGDIIERLLGERRISELLSERRRWAAFDASAHRRSE